MGWEFDVKVFFSHFAEAYGRGADFFFGVNGGEIEEV
jgi:hypothetical protein